MNLCKLNTIATIYNGNSINKTEKEQKYMNDVPGWNYIGTKDIDFNGKVTYKNGVIIPYTETKFRVAPAGTIFVCSEGGSAGKKSAIISEDVCFGNKLFAIVNDKGKFSSKYIYYYTRYSGFTKQFKLLATSLMGGISGKNFGTIEVPLPSIEEQHRIVSRIEELFSELDKGVETLQTIKQQLAVYRQAVLKAAFEGINSTKYMVKDVCKDIKVGIVIKPSQYYTDAQQGIKAFRSANVKEFHINNSDWVYLSQAGHSINSRSVVHTDDILIVRSGYPGTSCVVTEQFDGCNAIDILIAVPNKEIVLPQFLCAYTNSPFGKAFVSEKKRGVAQKHFNVSGYSKMMIPVPDLNKQREIVQEVESRLSVCDSIEQTVDTALSQAEAMRQSILKKAFEGGFSE